MKSRERVLTALNHRQPDRVPVDFGSFPGATSINVKAYQNFLAYLGLGLEVRVQNMLMHTGEVHDALLDLFHIDTKAVNPSISLSKFDTPEEFDLKPFSVKWRRSTDSPYAPIKGPFQGPMEPTLDDLKAIFRSLARPLQ
jgi:uroporphyrinogen decarboxylase